MKKPSLVAVLPFPLTAAALFGYGILRFLGYINEQTHTRFARVSNNRTTFFGCEGRIVYLGCAQLYLKMLAVPEVDEHIKRILTFAAFGDCNQSKTREIHSRLVSVLRKLNTNASRRALNETHAFIAEKRIRGWRSSEEIEALVATLESYSEIQTSAITYPPEKIFLDLPRFQPGLGKFKEVISKDDGVTGFFPVTLDVGRICELQDKHIVVTVGGPPNSGKSTLAVSLKAAVLNYVRGLKTSPSFSNLKFNVGYANIDLATPTGQAIEEGWGLDRAKLNKIKRPWTMEMAEEAQRILLQSRTEHNLVFTDLPGLTTDITRLLATSADAGIIISNDKKAAQNDWVPFMSSSGLPVVSNSRMRITHRGSSSIVTEWVPGKSLNGRMTSLDRNQRSYDSFIYWLALFLLFDILPTQFDAGS